MKSNAAGAADRQPDSRDTEKAFERRETPNDPDRPGEQSACPRLSRRRPGAPATSNTQQSRRDSRGVQSVSRHVPAILLVDDESEVREVMCEVLERAGYEVTSASQGVEALGLCANRTQPFDLVIADLTMPGMTGRELVHHITTGTPDTRVLLMSGFNDEGPDAATTDKNSRPVDQQPTRFIAKPFTPDGLLREVRETLEE